MKKLLFVLLLITSVAQVKAQDTTYTVGRNGTYSSHGYLVVFCGYDLGQVQPVFAKFLKYSLHYASTDFDLKSSPKENRIAAASYIKEVGTGKQTRINVSFYGRSLNNDIHAVDKCIIDGSFDEVVAIFIKYWETKLNVEEIKNKTEIVKYTGTDKIVFKSLQNGNAKITVTKN